MVAVVRDAQWERERLTGPDKLRGDVQYINSDSTYRR
jgi:hypothetical protein